jgi:hypothetical protein
LTSYTEDSKTSSVLDYLSSQSQYSGQSSSFKVERASLFLYNQRHLRTYKSI